MHYLIDGRLYEGLPIDRWLSDLVLICPRCGEAWGRVWDSGREWRGWTAGCENCAPWPLGEEVPGGLVDALPEGALEGLPNVLLKREFELTLRAMAL